MFESSFDVYGLLLSSHSIVQAFQTYDSFWRLILSTFQLKTSLPLILNREQGKTTTMSLPYCQLRRGYKKEQLHIPECGPSFRDFNETSVHSGSLTVSWFLTVFKLRVSTSFLTDNKSFFHVLGARNNEYLLKIKSCTLTLTSNAANAVWFLTVKSWSVGTKIGPQHRNLTHSTAERL
jgi:hypothetical protein